MNILIKRFLDSEEATIGRLYIDGEFFCYTLEDQYQLAKVPGETRIPEGIYGTRLKDSPKFTQRFGHLMIEITGIQNFSYVYFHPGVNDDDTSGCILVGDWRSPELWSLADSRATYDRLYARVAPHVGIGAGVSVEIVNMVGTPIPDTPYELPKPDPKPVVVEKPLGPDVSTTLWEDLSFHVREWLRGRRELIPALPGKSDLILFGIIAATILAAAIILRSC